MKIRFKLTLSMIMLSLLILGSVGITLLVQARSHIVRFSHESAMATANEYAKLFGGHIVSYWYLAQTTARLMEQYANIDVNTRRHFFNRTLEGILASNPDVLGLWSIWEPNALDGADALHIGTEGTNNDGRFAPYWYRANGQVRLRVLDGIGQPGQANDNYQRALRGIPGAIRDPFSASVGGREFLVASITATIHSQGRVVGVVGVDFDTDSIQETALRLFPFNNGVTKVFSNNGTVVGHHLYPYRIGTNILETELDMGGPYMDQLTRAVRQGEELYYTHFHPGFQAWMHMFITPIQIGTTDTPWSLALVIPRRDVLAAVYTMEITALIISLVVMALIIPMIIFIPRSLTRPIRKLTGILRDISEGEGDLTRTIEISSKDEVGSLAHYFNLTLEKIKKMIISIKDNTAELSGIGNELARNMTETAAAMNDIAANIQVIRGRAVNQGDSVIQTNVTMNKITGNIGELNGHVERQTNRVVNSSSAIEEMLANIQSVTNTLSKNAENVNSLSSASEMGRTGLREVAADIKEIAKESEGLLAINTVMENIAGQTNLLSMNAAIEAARAGESGKGFAVVAGEIRKLAENSSDQSRTIVEVLKKIKGAIDKITLSTETVMDRFEAIDSGVKTVAEQEVNIRNAMEEQGHGSKQILDAIGEVNEITLKVKSGSQEMLEGSKEVIQEGKNLGKAAEEITLGINNMATGTEQVNEKVSRINELSRKNQQGIDRLFKEVSRFKVN